MEMLDELKIPVLGQSVGGKLGRKILFNTETFEIKQKLIQKSITGEL
jgi:chemotaxis receptor (MCP) glutamine deamidase CheD